MTPWYPTNYRDTEGRFLDRPGVTLVAQDGPLAGRSSTVRDFDARLWIAIVDGRQMALSSRERPELPPNSKLLGYYLVELDPRRAGLYYHHADGRPTGATDPSVPVLPEILERLRWEDERAKRPPSV